MPNLVCEKGNTVFTLIKERQLQDGLEKAIGSSP